MTVERETIVILDYGSQYTQLIARRVREQQVYAVILPWYAPKSRVMDLKPKGFILSGIFKLGIPILGICYGMQVVAYAQGGTVEHGSEREYGPANVNLQDSECHLFAGLPETLAVWMSHGDRVTELPPGFIQLAQSDNGIIAAMGDPERDIYGTQFHPEVHHTPQGPEILKHFLMDICRCRGTWTPNAFIAAAVMRIREQVGAGTVIVGLCGGVVRAVVAALLHQAIGHQLMCIFVDTGLLRRGEGRQVAETFHEALGMELAIVNASQRFFDNLKGISDPEEKRRIIGEQFVRVFEKQARGINNARFLAQGTIYPDVIESAGSETAHRIKSHHNVGGLPEDMDLELVEPLRDLFKDEVRQVGLALGLPEQLVWRHPFPGPGLAVRILGEVTPDRVEVLQAADTIFLQELWDAGLYRDTSQAFAVLLPVRSVGVMGDGRTYANVVALRAVTTDDFMTADWARLPYDLLGRVANRIVNEVDGVNRVVYDVSSKPPATIEWE